MDNFTIIASVICLLPSALLIVLLFADKIER